LKETRTETAGDVALAGRELATKTARRRIWFRRGKWAVAAIVGLLVLDAGRVVPVFTAPWWLPERHAVGTTVIHSDAAISDQQVATVAAAMSRLEANDTWPSSDRSTRVLLISSPRTYAFLAGLIRRNSDSQGFGLGRTAVSSLSFVETMRTRWGAAYSGTIVDGDLAHIDAHEMAHMAETDRLGRSVYRRLPRWKMEGLAEYHSSDPSEALTDSELARRVRELLGPDGPQAGAIRRQYIEASLLLSYLTAVEGWRVDQIVGAPRDSTGLVSRMRSWAEATR